MTKSEAEERIKKLRKLINHHRLLYHVLDKQELSDEAFDSLKHELFLLEHKYQDLVTPDSPTQRVGGQPLEKFEKVEHKIPMLSIEDIFTKEEAKDWEEYLVKLSGKEKLEYFGELKMDGFAVSLMYKNGIFSAGSTRGNGSIGENVTQNLKTIESIPLRLEIENWKLKIPVPSEVEVRGEVYMEKKDFEKLNRERKKKGEEPFANPRNVAAGSIRQLDPKVAASRPLKFMAYALTSNMGQALHSQEHGILKALGFKTDKTAQVFERLEDAIDYWEKTGEKRDSLPFLVDGVVVSVNTNKIFQSLGVAGKGPRAIRAFKFSGKQTTTRILDVKLQVGRTGAVTPVAVLNPVQVGGVVVSRATLHNEDEMKRLDIKVGDTVIVQRAGDVIPAVVRVLKELREGSEYTFVLPSFCPACSARLLRPEGEAIWRCPNQKRCPAQQKKLLYHFVSKKAFDIKGLGPKILDAFVQEHLVSTPPDIFELKVGDLAPLERFGEKSAANIVQAINKSKRIQFSRFIFALGIRHVGEKTSQDLAEYFSSIQKFESAQKEDLERMPGVGGVVGESILEWFQSKGNQKLISELLRVGVRIQNPRLRQGYGGQAKFTGVTFVLTGELSSLSREKAKEKIRLFGGNISGSVSKKTSYLVAGENPGSKLSIAKELGVKILNEKEFLTLL